VAESPGVEYALEPAPDDVPDRVTQDLETIIAADSVAIRKKLPENAVSCRVVYGRVQNLIAETAGQWGADLIVIGSHGRKGFNRLLLGSVAEAVLHLAPCSVLIIKDEGKQKGAIAKSKSGEEAQRVKVQ
jgi:nucleotide-binding universal stress UspA family protein